VPKPLLQSLLPVLSLVPLVLCSRAALAQPLDYVPNQVIVKIHASVQGADVLTIRSSVHANVVRRFESIDAELWEIHETTVPDAVERLPKDSRVEFAEPNYIVRSLDHAGGAPMPSIAANDMVRALELIPNDHDFEELWGLHNTGQNGGTPDADIDAPEAWSVITGGDVVVAVIGTGVAYDHEDLEANIDPRGWDFFDNDPDPYDDDGPGTHCAGTIAAVGNNMIGVTGVCWSARVLPVKFMEGGAGTTAGAISAIQHAASMGAKVSCNPWGGSAYSEALRLAIEASGMLFVASAGGGSNNNDMFPIYPASYDLDNIIAVANTTRTDALHVASNYGLTSVDLGAPGTEILSTFPPQAYSFFSGTSMAAAHVAGAACLVWSYAPALSYLDVKNAILSTVDVIPALQGKTVSGGRLNVSNMLSLITGIDSNALPGCFALHANHPNPFNPATTIAYDLPEAVDVQLVIYDVRGESIRSLVSGARPAGHHSVLWDGRNDRGENVTSGVYFCRFTAGGSVQSRKMVLLK
jgi:subtilisin family serine protease